MTNGDEHEQRNAATDRPPPGSDTDPAPHDPADEHEYFAAHFRALTSRLDAQDKVLAEVATAAKLTAEASGRIVNLVNDSLALTKQALEMRHELDQHDFRIRLLELKLGMNVGECPE
jgi:hypothetical protein